MNPFQFHLLDRYLVGEILRPFAATCLLFVLLFSGYSSAKILADAVAGQLPLDIVWRLIGLKVVIALEVLLPIALYLAVVVGLGRLHTDSEIIAMAACGYGEDRVAWTALRLALVVAVIVGWFSIELRPWAYRQSYAIEHRAKAQFDINKLEARRFHAGENYVVFAEEVDRASKKLHGVFFSQDLSGQKTQVIYARSLTQAGDQNGSTPLVFDDGYAYELDFDGQADVTFRFQRLTLLLDGSVKPPGYRSKAAATGQLWHSKDPKDIAELQWRLARPGSVVLLALLAVPLSRTAPRTSRYGRAVLAVVMFAVYYNLEGLAKTWVKEGIVGEVPGLWWPDLVLLFSVGVWYFPLLSARFKLRKLALGVG